MPKHGESSKNKGPGFAPYSKDDKKSRAGAPPPVPSKQWRVSGGGTRSKAPPPASGSGPAAGKASDVLRVWEKDETHYWVIGADEGTGEAAMNWEDETSGTGGTTFELWRSMARGLRNKEVLSAYYFRHLLGCESPNEIDLHRAVLKVLSEGPLPRIEYDQGYDKLVDVWHRKDEKVVLGEARGTHLRYQGVDAIIFGSATAFWPPPVELVVAGGTTARDASVCWEMRLEADPEVGLLRAILEKGREKGLNGYFFRKADAEGRPTCTWFLKAADLVKDRKDIEFTKELNGFDGRAICKFQCALCLERPANGVSHDHTQCPLIGTLNKVRAQGGFKPLHFGSEGLVREDKQVELDLDAEVRKLKDLVDALSARVGRLEAGSSPNKGGPGGGKKGNANAQGLAGGRGQTGSQGGKGGDGKKGKGGNGGGGGPSKGRGQGEGSSSKGKERAA